MKRIVYILQFMLLASSSYAGSLTPDFKVERLLQWVDGKVKIFTDQPSVNGMEGCTAVDNSIALPAGSVGTDRILAMALAAKASNATMHAWVEGCCVTHSGKQSPCISTLTIK